MCTLAAARGRRRGAIASAREAPRARREGAYHGDGVCGDAIAGSEAVCRRGGGVCVLAPRLRVEVFGGPDRLAHEIPTRDFDTHLADEPRMDSSSIGNATLFQTDEEYTNRSKRTRLRSKCPRGLSSWLVSPAISSAAAARPPRRRRPPHPPSPHPAPPRGGWNQAAAPRPRFRISACVSSSTYPSTRAAGTIPTQGPTRGVYAA